MRSVMARVDSGAEAMSEGLNCGISLSVEVDSGHLTWSLLGNLMLIYTRVFSDEFDYWLVVLYKYLKNIIYLELSNVHYSISIFYNILFYVINLL